MEQRIDEWRALVSVLDFVYCLDETGSVMDMMITRAFQFSKHALVLLLTASLLPYRAHAVRTDCEWSQLGNRFGLYRSRLCLHLLWYWVLWQCCSGFHDILSKGTRLLLDGSSSTVHCEYRRSIIFLYWSFYIQTNIRLCWESLGEIQWTTVLLLTTWSWAIVELKSIGCTNKIQLSL